MDAFLDDFSIEIQDFHETMKEQYWWLYKMDFATLVNEIVLESLEFEEIEFEDEEDSGEESFSDEDDEDFTFQYSWAYT